MERTVLARLQYDGTHFAGWQRQRQARTVQGDFEAALARLCGRPTSAHGAGRTDAGVHALGMAVSATVPDRWTPAALRRALNALLAQDCWVDTVVEVRPGFHARKSASSRTYEYRIGTDPAARSPFRRPFEWALDTALDSEALRAAAAGLTGCRDFRGFAVQTATRRNCDCRVSEARWIEREQGRGWRFVITADRFLHHMVRILVGTMVDIARGRRDPAELARLLASTPGIRASPPAPPQGLYFVRADYSPRWFQLEAACS